ncbi:hypothetical protein MKZ38_007768 [Zalerion maritima]|uniref:High-affinity methionine permease n=1 Tax=Zalerion maritima TaxID=339359 RepID=A0AAD5WWE1_9PEZI|nr:hypothetical protein MKZ38_007768 [Zalerion maritima]
MNHYGGYPESGPLGPEYDPNPNYETGYVPQRTSGAGDSLRHEFIAGEEDPDEIVTDAPREKFQLSYLDVICLVINRMIGEIRPLPPSTTIILESLLTIFAFHTGTGIFVTPGKALHATRSVGVTLLLWFFGIFYSMSGAHVYVEYGLNVPRYIIDGVEQSVPRSGGDLNYLQYVYRKPRYKRETVIYMGVLFGISFICLGNMAGNCINFAERVLAASNPGQTDYNQSTIRGVALAMATFACFIHAFSRRGGILLNDILAITKIAILLFFVVCAIVVAAGGFKYEVDGETITVPNKFGANARPEDSFGHASKDGAGYAEAFTAIIFAITGFDQPNYVLGEIHQPQRRLPRAMFSSVGLVLTVYMLTNIAYMVVVDKSTPELLAQYDNIPLLFLNETFGKLGEHVGERMYNAFLAISSTGNIIVMTYTASRMKQEIAKEGFLPYSRFFAQSRDWSLGRFLHWLRKKGRLNWLTNWLVPENHAEKTPVGALLLHLLSCIILISATWGMTAAHAYDLLSGFIAYQLAAFFGIFLSLGILLLRFRGPPKTTVPGADNTGLTKQAKSGKMTWKEMTKGTVNHTMSVVCAITFLIGNLYPFIANWIPPADLSTTYAGLNPWYIMPLVSLCVLAFASLWWLGFIGMAKRREHKKGLIFVAERKQEFKYDGSEDNNATPSAERRRGRMILLHETVYLSWQGRDARLMQMDGSSIDDPSRAPEMSRAGIMMQQQHPPPPQAPPIFKDYSHLGL